MPRVPGRSPILSGRVAFTAPEGNLVQVDILPTTSACRIENSFKRICLYANGNPAFAKTARPAMVALEAPIFKPPYVMLPPRSERNESALAPLTPISSDQPAAAPCAKIPLLSLPAAATASISAEIKKDRSVSKPTLVVAPRQVRKVAVPGSNPAACPKTDPAFPFSLDHPLPRQNLTRFSPLQLAMPPAATPYRPDFAGAPALVIDGRQLYLPAGRYAFTGLLIFTPGSALPAKIDLAASGVRKKSFLFQDISSAFSCFTACRQILFKTCLLLPKPDIICLIADIGGSEEVRLLAGHLSLNALPAGNRRDSGAYTGKEETGRKEK